MKLFPIAAEFASKFQTKIRRISKELAYHIVTERVKPQSLILLGNGELDDQVAAILCHHLNGEKVAAIAKSQLTRVSALKNLPIYLRNLITVARIIEIFDQEEDSLDNIFENVKRTLQNSRIKHELSYESDRVKKYECILGSRAFDLIIIVSGLGDPRYIKHNVEEHLIHAAIKLGKLDPPDREKVDPRTIWRELPHIERLEVLKQLMNRKPLAKETFPQHWEGLELIV